MLSSFAGNQNDFEKRSIKTAHTPKKVQISGVKDLIRRLEEGVKYLEIVEMILQGWLSVQMRMGNDCLSASRTFSPDTQPL